ncbi:MAG: S8 family serine peptidase [Candidatus Zixiibacteriota bacterium]
MKKMLTTLRDLTLIGTVLILLSFQLLMADNFQPNILIIKMESNKSIQSILDDINGTVIDSIEGQNIYLVSSVRSFNADSMASSVCQNQGVLFAQPNYLADIPEGNQISQSFPDDRRPSLVYNISPPDYFGQDNILTINSDDANLISTGEGVLIGIIDNGIAFEHPLFQGFIANNGYDFNDNDTDPSEEPGIAFGHGTFVAGLIKRVAPDCQIVPLRAFNGDGLGTVFSIAQAIYWAIDNDLNILNMSFSLNTTEFLIAEATRIASQNNIIMVASCGNDGLEIMTYPAAYNNVIAVTSIDKQELLADFSNYGKYLDVCAPGVDIYSSLAGEYEWGTWSGTSFSTPMVSAACALVSSIIEDNGSIASRVKGIIRSSARTELLWGTVIPRDNEYGFGCLDAREAVISVVRGDVDNSGEINILDINYLVKYLYYNGPEPVPFTEIGDIDKSGIIDYNDIQALISLINSNNPGSPPIKE